MYCVAMDIADRRRAEAELREAHQLVEASRDGLRVLAGEQAALRRVATLVAKGASPDDVFAAGAEEVGRLLSVDSTAVLRYEADNTTTVVAGWAASAVGIPVGARLPLEGHSTPALVHRTERPALIDDYASATGELAARMRETAARSAAGSPIFVDVRPWGVMVAGSMQPEPLPAGTESRIAHFTELLGTAISYAQNRADLAASRARLVAAVDETRRRIERDPHDGVHQRLVSLQLELRAIETDMPPDDERGARLADTESGLTGALEELRRSREASIRRSSRTGVSGRPSGRLPAARPSRSSSTYAPTARCQSGSKSRHTTSSRRRLRTPPSTRAPPSGMSTPRIRSSSSPSPTTVSAEPNPRVRTRQSPRSCGGPRRKDRDRQGRRTRNVAPRQDPDRERKATSACVSSRPGRAPGAASATGQRERPGRRASSRSAGRRPRVQPHATRMREHAAATGQVLVQSLEPGENWSWTRAGSW